MNGITEFIDAGAMLGQLWMEGHFEVGDPLINSGAEKQPNLVKKSPPN
jgi:hypothetical protein